MHGDGVSQISNMEVQFNEGKERRGHSLIFWIDFIMGFFSGFFSEEARARGANSSSRILSAYCLGRI